MSDDLRSPSLTIDLKKQTPEEASESIAAWGKECVRLALAHRDKEHAAELAARDETLAALRAAWEARVRELEAQLHREQAERGTDYDLAYRALRARLGGKQ